MHDKCHRALYECACNFKEPQMLGIKNFFTYVILIGIFSFPANLFGAAKADVSLTKTASSPIVTQGTNMSYTLTVSNLSNSTNAQGISIIDILPLGMTYADYSGSGWNCSGSGTPVSVTCTLSELAKSSSSALTLNVVAPTTTTSITNTATVSTSITDDDVPANNTGSAVVTLNRPPVAVNDSVSTVAHTAVNGNVLTNDSDPDNDTLSVLNPGTYTLSFGSIVINSNGTFTYTPGYFTGETDQYTYTVSDGRGGTATAVLSINIGTSCTDTGLVNAESDFCLRKQSVLFGGMKTIGNSLVVPPDPQPTNSPSQTTYCSGYTNGAYLTDLNNVSNQSLYLCSYKPDSNLNATKAELIVPAGSKVKWAGLYLQSVVRSADSSNLLNMDVKIKKDNGTYLSVGTPTLVNYKRYLTNKNSTNYDNYSAYINVTNLFTSNNWASGNYTIANVPVTTDTLKGDISWIGKYGAWTLLVIYEDINSPLKSIAVYDGWKQVTGTTSRSVTVSNFYTPSSGTIDSEVSVFTAEGDKYLGGDNFKVGTTNLGTTDNAFNSEITGMTGVRSPSLSNNQGIDIKTYQLGTSGYNLLGYNQQSITFDFSTNYDYYYPSMLAFSTEVYHPKMCYYEDIYSTTGKLTNGSIIDKGSPLKVKVLLKNDQQEPAEKVLLYKTFDSSMPYTANTTGYNANPTDINSTTTLRTDALDGDIFDYSQPLNLFSLHAGTGATYNQGGDFNPNQKALFDYNTTANFDGNTSIKYQIAYTMPTIGYKYEGELAKCVDFNNTFGTVAPDNVPVVGDFNVVHTNEYNAALSSHYYYNLPTQIASRADNYKVIGLDVGTNVLKDFNTTVGVELVDADSAGTCSAMTSLSDRVWVVFNNSSITDFNANTITYNSGNTISPAGFYQKANKNTRFKITKNEIYGSGDLIKTFVIASGPHAGNVGISNFTELAQGLQAYNSALPVNEQNKCRIPVVYGNHTYTTMPESCGNASGTNGISIDQLQICMECVYGTNSPATCSKDNFAIRPEAYQVKLYDQNKTNPVTKQYMLANTPAPLNTNIAAGYNYYAEVNATNHLDNTSTPGYNTDQNVSFIWSSTQTGCNDDTNKSLSFSFANGTAVGNVGVNQVGQYRLSIKDTTWTAVDNNVSLMAHHVAPYFRTTANSDCIADSAITTAVGGGLNGCNIDTDHINSVAGIAYTNTNVTFHPYKFDLSSLSFGVGTQPREINASVGSNNDFVYISDMSDDNAMNMSLRGSGNIVPRGENNATLSNFVKNCYAKNINLTMNSDANLTIPGIPFQYRFVDTNSSGATIYDSNATNITNVQFMTVSDGNFTKDRNGVIASVMRFNFDRNQTTFQNPKLVQYTDFRTECATAAQCTMQADLINSHTPSGLKAMDFNVTHVYGRLIPRDVRVFGSVPFRANAWYEVYNSPSLLGTVLPRSRNDNMWYTNTRHNDAGDGDGTVTQWQVGTAASTPVSVGGVAVSGMETYGFAAQGIGGYKAHIDTDPWLWYGISALDYQDPQTGNLEADCLHHPCFNVTVVPAIGATGSSREGMSDDKTSKKSDSSGNWKSHSDYAPATR